MKIQISAESTIDLPKDLLDKYNIKTIPFTVIIGDNEKLDGEIDNNEIYDFVDKTKKLPKTSAVNKVQYEEYFKELLKTNDAVIHFCLSSEISSAYNNAVSVSQKMKNVYIVDTRSLSTGIALLALKASDMVNEGYDCLSILNEINNQLSKVRSSFILNKLQYLAKGGRCSALTAFGANLLMIKPQIIVKDGRMQVGKKYVGKFETCLQKYCDDTLNASKSVDKKYAFITYSSANQQMIDIAFNALKQKGFENIYKTMAGSTISSHCGPNTLGILFLEG